MSETIGPVWVTKYALSRGIERIERVYFILQGDGDIYSGPRPVADGRWFFGEGSEWHRTESAAIVRAEEMRKAGIASLKKQIARLESLKFGSAS